MVIKDNLKDIRVIMVIKDNLKDINALRSTPAGEIGHALAATVGHNTRHQRCHGR